MNFCGERFKPNLCRVQKKTNFSKKGCEIWVCQLKFFARKIANLGQTSVSAKFTFRNFAEKIYLHGVKNGSAIGNFCAEKRTNFLRGSKSEFKQNQWMWRVFALISF